MSLTMTSEDVMRLRDLTGAGLKLCRHALAVRGGDFELAEEYVRRVGLAAVMTEDARFPKWSARKAAKKEDEK